MLRSVSCLRKTIPRSLSLARVRASDSLFRTVIKPLLANVLFERLWRDCDHLYSEGAYMRPCKHCGSAFEPAGRQLYCKPEHKQAHDVAKRREWRRLVRGVSKWLTLENARAQRASRDTRYMRLAGVVGDFGPGPLPFVPDSEHEAARRKGTGADVSNWPARSAQFVWQLDGRWLKERDRLRYGFPADYEVLSVARAKRMYPNPQTITETRASHSHTCVVNGLYPRRNGECSDCDALMGIARHRAAKAPHKGMILLLGELGDYGNQDEREPALAA